MTTFANRGKPFEAELEACHSWYARMGLAWLARFHVPKVYTRKGVVYTARTWCDLSGFLSNGRAILLEAKSMQKEHAWKPDRGHQLQMLQTANRCGALGLYLVRVDVDTVYLWKPPLEYRFGEKVTWSDCTPIERVYYERPWKWLERIKELEW